MISAERPEQPLGRGESRLFILLGYTTTKTTAAGNLQLDRDLPQIVVRLAFGFAVHVAQCAGCLTFPI